MYDFAEPCVAIVKHANPCGIAVGEDVAQAHQKANDADPISAYGGVIAVNTTLSAEMAAQVADVFTEVVVASEYEDLALEILTTRKDLRLLRCAAPRSRGGGNGDASAVGCSCRPPTRWTRPETTPLPGSSWRGSRPTK